MARGATVVAGLAVAGGILALVIANRRVDLDLDPHTEPPPDTYTIPTVEEILSSANLYELDDYYNQLTQLYQNNQITQEEYTALYDAYEQRFYELREEI